MGFAYAHIEFTASGRDACIVHLQLARDCPALADWIVAETARRLALRGVGIIRCCASTEAKIAALRKAGFISWKPRPAFWWPKPDVPRPAQIDAGYLRADDFISFTALRGRWMANGHEGTLQSAV
ncbi:hypothetical protein [Dankookia sp. P2]|uniref:hypothetical protein n=1 Tax=Dankookia sp. P2 TaxID=3423955 RepID=UPI003D6642DF